jgi:hypothetical protein
LGLVEVSVRPVAVLTSLEISGFGGGDVARAVGWRELVGVGVAGGAREGGCDPGRLSLLDAVSLVADGEE